MHAIFLIRWAIMLCVCFAGVIEQKRVAFQAEGSIPAVACRVFSKRESELTTDQVSDECFALRVLLNTQRREIVSFVMFTALFQVRCRRQNMRLKLRRVEHRWYQHHVLSITGVRS